MLVIWESHNMLTKFNPMVVDMGFLCGFRANRLLRCWLASSAWWSYNLATQGVTWNAMLLFVQRENSIVVLSSCISISKRCIKIHIKSLGRDGRESWFINYIADVLSISVEAVIASRTSSLLLHVMVLLRWPTAHQHIQLLYCLLLLLRILILG